MLCWASLTGPLSRNLTLRCTEVVPKLRVLKFICADDRVKDLVAPAKRTIDSVVDTLYIRHLFGEGFVNQAGFFMFPKISRDGLTSFMTVTHAPHCFVALGKAP